MSGSTSSQMQLRPRKGRTGATERKRSEDWLEWRETRIWAKTNLNCPPPSFHSRERYLILQQIQDDMQTLTPGGKSVSKSQHLALKRLRQNLVIAAPVRLLPPEVLSHIFNEAVPEAVQFPSRDLLAIIQTCHRWHQIAQGTPALWTCINFFLDKQRTRSFLEKGELRCVDYLNKWLRLSGSLLLSIASVGHGANLPSELFEAILSQLHRVRRLALLHCSSTYIKRFFSTRSAGINLRQLDLGAGCEEVINDTTYGGLGMENGGWGILDFPNLESVFLHSLPADVMLHIRAPNLLHLSFARCWTCPYALNAISQSFPKLTHLKMMSFSLHQHDSHLLSIENGPGIPLTFPELTHFLWLDSRPPGNPHITPYSSENINLAALALSPKLKFGWIDVRNPTFIKPAILPHLVDLRLQVEMDIHHEIARRIFSGMDRLKILTIERTRFASSSTRVEGIIASLSMSRVDLSSLQASTNAPDGMPKWSLTPPYPPLCPRLERLTITECYVSPSEILRFACLRRAQCSNANNSNIIETGSHTSNATYPPTRVVLPLSNVLPCRITLRGCPGLPTTEKSMFLKLYSDINSFVRIAPSLSEMNSLLSLGMNGLTK